MPGSSFALRVPVAEGRNPFRVVRRSPYSCRGIDPYGIQRATKYVPGTDLAVVVLALAWSGDPRGSCGDCPACTAVQWDNGVWSALAVEPADS